MPIVDSCVNRRHLRLLAAVLLGLGLLTVVAIRWWPRHREARNVAEPVPASTPGTALAPAPAAVPAPAGVATRNPDTVEPAAAMVIRIEDALARLQALEKRDTDGRERAAVVRALRIELRAAGQKASAEAMALFLESGRDAPTGLRFGPARDGFLETAPSLRTLLLDELERIDAASAREAAQTVFAASNSADEWALALRIVAHTTPANDAGARQAFRHQVQALLTDAAWLAAPTAGFLQAFDAAVYAHDPAMVDQLAHLAADGQDQAVQFAARLALERIVIADYPTGAGRLADDHSLLAGNPDFRGRLLARADVRQAGDRAVLERFLNDPQTPAAELEAWAKYFPDRSKHLSNNLLTSDGPTPIPELARMDRAALNVVRAWQSDPSMADRHALLAPVQARLERYVAQANASRAANPPP